MIGAAAVSTALGETVDGIAIIAIVILNAPMGFIQEYCAEKAAAALADMVAPHCRVMRNGHSVMVVATEIVPGDILLRESGDLVTADARLIQASVLRINEAPLNGESQAVNKFTDNLPPETALVERKNMVFLSAGVTGGSGLALIVNAVSGHSNNAPNFQNNRFCQLVKIRLRSLLGYSQIPDNFPLPLTGNSAIAKKSR